MDVIGVWHHVEHGFEWLFVGVVEGLVGVTTAEAVVAGLAGAAGVCAEFDPDLLPAVELGVLLEAAQRQTNRIDAAVLAWTASFDRRNGARASGHRNTQQFLQNRLRQTAGQAKTRADTARRLSDGLADTREALQRGDITTQHAAAIVKGIDQAKGDDDGHAAERELLACARREDDGQVRRAARRLELHNRSDDADVRARAAYRQRHLSFRHDGDTTWVEGRLHQAAGERVAARLQALAGRAGLTTTAATGSGWRMP